MRCPGNLPFHLNLSSFGIFCFYLMVTSRLNNIFQPYDKGNLILAKAGVFAMGFKVAGAAGNRPTLGFLLDVFALYCRRL